MALESIGFHAALILNRLRLQAQLTACGQDHEPDCERETQRERHDEQSADDKRQNVVGNACDKKQGSNEAP